MVTPTRIAFLTAVALHVTLAYGVKMTPPAPLPKPTETYVEVTLYDPPSEPPSSEVPLEPEPPIEPEPMPEVMAESAPAPPEVQPPPPAAIVEPAPPPKMIPPPPKPANAPPKTKAAPAAPTATAPTGNSYQAVSSLAYLNRRTPVYPPEALRQKQAGTVTLMLYVNEFGTVDKVEVLSSSGIASLDEAALAAAKKSTFRPVVEGGKPIKSKAKLPFKFQVR